jgi:hypothetical protein
MCERSPAEIKMLTAAVVLVHSQDPDWATQGNRLCNYCTDGRRKALEAVHVHDEPEERSGRDEIKQQKEGEKDSLSADEMREKALFDRNCTHSSSNSAGNKIYCQTATSITNPSLSLTHSLAHTLACTEWRR